MKPSMGVPAGGCATRKPAGSLTLLLLLIDFAQSGEVSRESRCPAQFQIDDSPATGESMLPASFAPIMKQVAPCAVGVFTTKKVTNFRRYDAFSFFAGSLFPHGLTGKPSGRASSFGEARLEELP